MLLVGTSGWSYDDWVGPVYPKHLANRRGAWLAHYARDFATVEVNSTFYQLPYPGVVEGWVDKAEAIGGALEFSLKAPRKVTHTAMVDGEIDTTREGLAELVERIGPLRRAGRLGAVLLQLSPHFHGGPEEVELLDAALGVLSGKGGAGLAVEFRHRTWLDPNAPDEAPALRPEAVGVLADHGAAACVVDGPSFPTLLPGATGEDRASSTADHAYVRFHGRRRDAWFGATGLGEHARSDYRYREDELAPWAGRLGALDASHARVRAYFNNHPGGQAFHNAARLRDMMGLARPDRPSEGQRRLDAF